jgi:hypothetical protein
MPRIRLGYETYVVYTCDSIEVRVGRVACMSARVYLTGIGQKRKSVAVVNVLQLPEDHLIVFIPMVLLHGWGHVPCHVHVVVAYTIS